VRRQQAAFVRLLFPPDRSFLQPGFKRPIHPIFLSKRSAPSELVKLVGLKPTVFFQRRYLYNIVTGNDGPKHMEISPMGIGIAKKRLELISRRLDKASVADDALVQFRAWYEQAREAEVEQYGTMALATASAAGRPSARMVLLEGVDERGLLFFTGFESRKGYELSENPWAALLFWWGPLYRQIRIEGKVTRLADAEIDAYFQGRPRQHQLESWASRQSQAIESRQTLIERFEEAKRSFGKGKIARPDDFGGYVLRPETIDFWQARLDWLHDWVQYERAGEEAWRIRRLSP
jgi:pyridoxamine 5'-phosphate oxidase